MSVTRSRSAQLFAFTALVLGGACAPEDESETATNNAINDPGCFVAFIHGSGRDYSAQPGQSWSFWAPPLDGNVDPVFAEHFSLIEGVTRAKRCKYRAIGYRGKEAFWDDVPNVASQLQSFIDAERIPDKKLILITHSMGGLVARYLLNGGEPNSVIYRPEYESVKRKVAYAITIQAPHRGSEAADAIYGEASAVSANVGGITIRFLGFESPTNARMSMTRAQVESAVRRWLSDEGRTTTLYTIGGTATNGGKSRTWINESVESNDSDLDTASTILFLGQEDTFDNDGAVEQRSAHGQAISKERVWKLWSPGLTFRYNNDHIMAGALRRWVNTPLNHNHARMNTIDNTDFTDVVTGRTVQMSIARKISEQGLALPCSDPETRNERWDIPIQCRVMGL